MTDAQLGELIPLEAWPEGASCDELRQMLVQAAYDHAELGRLAAETSGDNNA